MSGAANRDAFGIIVGREGSCEPYNACCGLISLIGMKAKAQNPKERTKRPGVVTIVAWLHILQSIGLLGYGINLVANNDWVLGVVSGATQFIPFALVESMTSDVVLILLATLTLFVGIALLRLIRWAWVAAMTIQGLGLLAALIGYVSNRPNYLGMLVGIILVLYLNHAEVQAAFREKRRAA